MPKNDDNPFTMKSEKIWRDWFIIVSCDSHRNT